MPLLTIAPVEDDDLRHQAAIVSPDKHLFAVACSKREWEVVWTMVGSIGRTKSEIRTPDVGADELRTKSKETGCDPIEARHFPNGPSTKRGTFAWFLR